MAKLTFINKLDNLVQLFEHDPVVQKNIAEWCSTQNNPCDFIEFDTPSYSQNQNYFYNCYKIKRSIPKEFYGYSSTSKGFYYMVLNLLIAFYSGTLNGNGIKFEFNSTQELTKALYNLFTNICSLMCLTHQIGNKMSATQMQGNYIQVINQHSGAKEECKLVACCLDDYSQDLVRKASYNAATASTQDWLCFTFKVYSMTKKRQIGLLQVEYDFVSPLGIIAAALLNSSSLKDFASQVFVKGIVIFSASDDGIKWDWDCNTTFGPIKVSEINLRKDINRLVIK